MVVFGRWTSVPLWTLESVLIEKGVADKNCIQVIDKAAVR